MRRVARADQQDSIDLTLHILFTRQHQLVIDDVIGQKAKSVKCTGRMKVHRYTRSTILIFTDPFHLGGLVEITCTYTFALDPSKIRIRSLSIYAATLRQSRSYRGKLLTE